MDARDAGKIVGAITDLRRSVDSLDKTTKNAARDIARSMHPSTHHGNNLRVVFGSVPASLDWVSPHISSIARFLKNDDGSVTIEITVNDSNALVIEQLVEEKFIEALTVSSIDPSHVRT